MNSEVIKEGVTLVMSVVSRHPMFYTTTHNKLWEKALFKSVDVNKTHVISKLTREDCTIDIYKDNGLTYHYPAFLNGLPKPGMYQLAINSTYGYFSGWVLVKEESVHWYGGVYDDTIYFGCAVTNIIEDSPEKLLEFDMPIEHDIHKLYIDRITNMDLNKVLRSMDAHYT